MKSLQIPMVEGMGLLEKYQVKIHKITVQVRGRGALDRKQTKSIKE